MQIRLESVPIRKPEETNIIIGQSHFIKTVEDLHEAMVNMGGGIKFGIAFSEASGACLIRLSGNDDRLVELAKINAQNLGAGHSFIILMENGFPINVLNAIKAVPEVCSIFCATANPLEVVIAATSRGRGIMGVIDGEPPKGVEKQEDKDWRYSFLRNIGYKL